MRLTYIALFAFSLFASVTLQGQESPYFVTYDHYLEYENINEASRIRKEIVGAAPELNESNAELRATRAHELETRLILSSTAHDWNISENFIVEKNLSENEGFEFGYALAVARPLA